ncbi:M48 family metalloprotease, partial [Candidatus Daviesbacteria bacterium]|nr:M48 family metalloprotease [Candidatus Daviesbacteria bacterium]
FFLRSLWFGRSRDRGGGLYMVLAIAAAILAPIAAMLIQLAVSRRRELLADASGVLLTRYPAGLASALQKISSDRQPLKTAHTGTAHLFIVNPLKGKEAGAWLVGLFNTHPPIAARLKALHEMEGKV